MARFLLLTIIAYFIYRLLDSIFRPTPKKKPESKQRVSVQYDPEKAKSKVGKDVGEYIDYEEIKD